MFLSLPFSLPLSLSSFFKILFLKILFIHLFIFREGKGGRKRGRETSMCGCLSHSPTGDLARNPSMCPEWESNQQSFGSQANAQSRGPPRRKKSGIPFFSFFP